MNGFLLLIPFFILRFGLLLALNPKAVPRAAYFAPMRGAERCAYVIYQLSNLGLFLSLLFLRVDIDFSALFWCGIICYLAGLCLCAASVSAFSFPDESGLNTNGVYRFSRNPMYVAYFICFAGMALLTRSFPLLGLVLIFQISAHWIILAEERWCLERFGDAYAQYRKRVRRYLKPSVAGVEAKIQKNESERPPWGRVCAAAGRFFLL